MKWGFAFVLTAALAAGGCVGSNGAGGNEPPPGGYDAQYVETVLADARSFASQGMYEEALQKHIWYHENALKYAETAASFRLTFALNSWVLLGEKYPKAKEALAKIRDGALTKLKADPKDDALFAEVEAINFALKDMKAARDLYYERPDVPLVESRLFRELDQVIETKDSKWLRDVVGDPEKVLAAIAAEQKKAEDAEGEGGAPGPGRGGRQFGPQVAALVRAVKALDGDAAAKAFQTKALEVVDSREVRNALETPDE